MFPKSQVFLTVVSVAPVLPPLWSTLPATGGAQQVLPPWWRNLLVEGLGVGGGGRDVGVTGGLVGAGGQLELVGRLEVGVAGLAVGTGVVLEVEKLGEHSARRTGRR